MVKNLPANVGAAIDTGLNPGSGRSPGEGNGNPLQYSCLGNPMDRRALWATVHGVEKSWTPFYLIEFLHSKYQVQPLLTLGRLAKPFLSNL